MSINKKYNAVFEYISIMLGTIVFALAINMFYDPNEIAMGGVSGLGIITRNLAARFFAVDTPLWLLNLLFNTPLLIAGYYIMGREFISRSIFGVLFLTLALSLTKFVPVFQGDIALIIVYGGILQGIGIGLVFRGFGTTGGSDIAASIIHKFWNHVPVSKGIFFLDFSVIFLGFFVFGIEKAMYSVISVFISSKCIETMLEGMSFSKAAFIISDYAPEISAALLKDLHRGVTALQGRGMYTNNQKDVLLCVFSAKEIALVKRLVKDIDEGAFILLTDIKEVLGEGFQPIKG